MKSSMYCIYDTISEMFNKPFVEHNDQSAIRVFTQSIKEHAYDNRNDFALYKLGDFNDSNGIINGLDIPLRVYSGLDMKSDPVPDEASGY